MPTFLCVHTAGVDYTLVPTPSLITLTNGTRTVCANVSITEDMLVEGQETFEVYFEVDDYVGSYAVNGSNSTMITILDSNGEKWLIHHLMCTDYMHNNIFT